MTTTTATQLPPDPGPGYRLLRKEPEPELVQEGDEFLDPTIGWTSSYNSNGKSGGRQSCDLYYRRKIAAASPQPEPPTPPTPVAPTEPGLYPLADGTTVWLVGPDYAGDWVGMRGDFARCWRHNGSGRAVPDVIGPRIPEPVDPAAAFACVNELAAAGRVEWLSRDGEWHHVPDHMQFRGMTAHLTPPPADWPQELRDAAIEQAQKRGLEVRTE